MVWFQTHFIWKEHILSYLCLISFIEFVSHRKTEYLCNICYMTTARQFLNSLDSKRTVSRLTFESFFIVIRAVTPAKKLYCIEWIFCENMTVLIYIYAPPSEIIFTILIAFSTQKKYNLRIMLVWPRSGASSILFLLRCLCVHRIFSWCPLCRYFIPSLWLIKIWSNNI